MSVSIIIPAYRAADRMAATVMAAHTLAGVGEVIVVDDGSRDGTSEAARAAGADRVITLPRNVGKGGAMRAGLAIASGDTVLFLDADLGESAAQAAPLLEAIRDRPAMSIAVFPKREGTGGFGIAKGAAAAVIRLFTGLTVTAPLSGQRAMPTAVARTLGIAPRFAAEVALTTEAAHAGLPIIEQPVTMDHRHTGRDVAGFRHRFRQFADVMSYAIGMGYGMSWPALHLWQILLRVFLWIIGFAALLYAGWQVGLGSFLPEQYVGWAILALLFWLPSLWFTAVKLKCWKTNYLGRILPGAAGFIIPFTVLLAILLQIIDGMMHGIYWDGVLYAYAVVILVFGFVGLVDDVFAGQRHQARGLHGHFSALFHGKITTGAIKAIGGLLGALVAAIMLYDGEGPVWEWVVNGLIIALTANLLNLLDLRPGRTLKGFFLLIVPILIIKPVLALLTGSVLAATLVYAPSDLAGRVMLGDVGANVLGGAAGFFLVLALTPAERIIALILLLAIHVYCERYSLTDVIARNRVLHWLDKLGTRHLEPLPSAVPETPNPKP